MTKNIFVSSDHHFGHKNILKFCPESRPFESVEEHDEQLIVRHNAVVKSTDDVYFLGDFGFCPADRILRILKRMNGTKHFIFGNHDKQMRRAAQAHNSDISKEFVWMKDYHEMNVGKQAIIMFHYPIHSWNKMHHGSLHFYGHTHSGIPELFSGRAKDIGVDSNNCYPWNIDDLVILMSKCEVVDARNRQNRDVNDDYYGQKKK